MPRPCPANGQIVRTFPITVTADFRPARESEMNGHPAGEPRRTVTGRGPAVRKRYCHLYPAIQCFAVVYTANHYVVDLLIGLVYATLSIVGVRWFWRRRGWPE